MKAQRRRFVVEVKRGTSRASFLSTDAAAEKFSSAEDALFGPKVKPTPVPEPSVPASAGSAAKGRVLPDLHEPPPPPLPEAPPPARRGRKPGSKNKPKPVLEIVPSAAEPSPRPLWADGDDARDTARDLGSVPEAEVSGAEAAVTLPTPAVATSAPAAHRVRLRDRSTILKRYVLGTEPAPGQTGWVRGLRSRRQG